MALENDSTDARVVYVGVPDPEEARLIGRTVVEERLAGAANLVPGVTALFWWDGALREKEETTLVLFTLDKNVPQLTARIQSLHSYVTPGIKVWTVTGGSQEWLSWLHAEATGSPKPGRPT